MKTETDNQKLSVAYNPYGSYLKTEPNNNDLGFYVPKAHKRKKSEAFGSLFPIFNFASKTEIKSD